MTGQDIKRVAAEANVDPRTVTRLVRDGLTPRSLSTRDAIVRAMKSCGFKAEASRLEKRKAS